MREEVHAGLHLLGAARRVAGHGGGRDQKLRAVQDRAEAGRHAADPGATVRWRGRRTRSETLRVHLQNNLMWDGRIETVVDPRDHVVRAWRAVWTLGGVLTACRAQESSETFYKASSAVSDFNVFTTMPCGVCPVRVLRMDPPPSRFPTRLRVRAQVFDQCTPGGIISPTTCVYMPKWLEF